MDKLLLDVYYDSPAAYSGVQNVYDEAKKRNKSITLKTVREFLSRQDAYTLHKDVKRRFHRNQTRSAGIDTHWQADLADLISLKSQNQGYAYILICIDVLSRFVFAEPVKRKTPELIAAAFETILKRSGRKCWF